MITVFSNTCVKQRDNLVCAFSNIQISSSVKTIQRPFTFVPVGVSMLPVDVMISAGK